MNEFIILLANINSRIYVSIVYRKLFFIYSIILIMNFLYNYVFISIIISLMVFICKSLNYIVYFSYNL
jgi:hypothetical protein